MKTTTILFTAFALCSTATLVACDGDKKADGKKAGDKKAGDKKADAKKADDKKADAKGDAKADPKKADPKADAPTGDALVVTASHEPAKPEDPVKVTFTGLKVVKAEFNPKDPTGGTMQVEIDPGSLNSGSDKRDGHLKSGDYLDVAKFAAIKVDVSDIAKAGDAWTAKLVVDAHGKQVTWDKTPFKITATTDTAITVNLVKEFQRTDFEVGKTEGDSTAAKVSAELTMTIAKTN